MLCAYRLPPTPVMWMIIGEFTTPISSMISGFLAAINVTGGLNNAFQDKMPCRSVPHTPVMWMIISSLLNQASEIEYALRIKNVCVQILTSTPAPLVMWSDH
ncbi:hypothetical protein AVEN_260257-1 [Araneus ventricosus]|uniref:Uncharacterized protein n=1 Tax=Araneus ventricosus TaxID=182803 RepID=A0A4Y2FNL1_ARAVE|nr:hypothetical protein AVEN_260257-1 [Araneus ventricosus]